MHPTIPFASLVFCMAIDDAIYRLIRLTPKVVLHDHLGGSSDISVLKARLIDLGQREGLEWETLRHFFRVDRGITYEQWPELAPDDDHADTPAPPWAQGGDRSTLEAYRVAYDRSAQLVRSLSAQYMAAYLYVHRAVDDHVRYAEIRFNPFGKGGTPEELTRFICEGLNDGKLVAQRSGKRFDYGLIMTAYRHGDPTLDPDTGLPRKVKRALEVAKMAARLQQQGYPVVGVDIAGNEADNPITDFAPMLDWVKTYNRQQAGRGLLHQRLGITLHAGETPTSGTLTGAESVRLSVELAWDELTPVRIGHGIHADGHPDLLELLKTKGVGVELCPKSNAQTLAVLPHHPHIPSYTHHPARRFLEAGVLASISSDNQTVSNSNSTNEFVKLYQHLGITHALRQQFVLNGVRTAFVFDEEQAQTLLADVQAGLNHLQTDAGLAKLIAHEAQQAQQPASPPTTKASSWWRKGRTEG